jgi:hypothetical protein
MNDLEMADGPKVIKHVRDGITVWTIHVPKQYSPGGHVFWGKCVAVATPGHRASLSCEGHGPERDDDRQLTDDDRPNDDVRRR